MIQTPNSASQYQANILAALQATGITNTSPGAKARAFGDAVGDQVSPPFRNQNISRARQAEAPSMIQPHTVLALSGARQTETLSMTVGPASSWLPHLVQEGKLEWVSPSFRNQNTSRAHAGNRRFTGVENSLISPQFACPFYWPVFDAK